MEDQQKKSSALFLRTRDSLIGWQHKLGKPTPGLKDIVDMAEYKTVIGVVYHHLKGK